MNDEGEDVEIGAITILPQGWTFHQLDYSWLWPSYQERLENGDAEE